MNTEVVTDFSAPLPMWNPALPGRPLTGLTVLVVEDSRYSSEAMRLLCLRSGARVRRADCLKSAWRHLQTYRPDVVIVDIGLPDGDGASMIRELSSATPRLSLILGLSGDPELCDLAMSAGADGFMAKPIDNLVMFQQAILSRMPEGLRRWGLAAVPDEKVLPDPATLREDYQQVSQTLSGKVDATTIDYVARFLAGIARSTNDESLALAAVGLTNDEAAGQPATTDLTQINGMLEQRLAQIRPS